jgi:hypothetical protein
MNDILANIPLLVLPIVEMQSTEVLCERLRYENGGIDVLFKGSATPWVAIRSML